MSRRAHLYARLLGISANPFPDIAIAQSHMQAFDPGLHPDLPARMARTFLGSDPKKAAKVTFLWSLGNGDEARGYGKSAYLMWMADQVNADLGASALRLCDVAVPCDRVMAAYSSFSTVDGALSLSGVMFNAARELVTSYAAVLERLRDAALHAGDSKMSLLLRAQGFAAAGRTQIDGGMLNQLVYAEGEQWPQVFDAMSIWHRQRWGRRLFGSLVAFLKSLGISRVLLLIDQLEDFTGNSPSSRLYRDFGRIAELCQDDALFSDALQIVIALHPRAQFVVQYCWAADKLGPLPALDDQTRCVIVPALTSGALKRLVDNYLTAVRITESVSTHPFTPLAIERLCELCSGRPGEAIKGLHHLIEEAIDRGLAIIDEQLVEEMVSK